MCLYILFPAIQDLQVVQCSTLKGCPVFPPRVWTSDSTTSVSISSRRERVFHVTLSSPKSRLSVFTGRDPAKWHTRLPIARRIRFRSVYPGIDLVYHGSGSRLEYDFEVAPGAAVSRIQLGFAPSAVLKISAAGDLSVSANGSTLIQHRPRVQQGNREIPANYMIDRTGNHVRIELGPYDHSQPLTIDPVLAWEAAVNGGGTSASAVAADRAGNMWILTDFPPTSPSYSKTFGAGGASRDLVLLKVDPTGSNLLYAVRIGGSGNDFGNALAIGSDGSAYITGSTGSADFPVTANAFQATLPSVNGGAAYVVKLDPKGDSLIYSTYLGGSAGANGTAIAVDQTGNAFVSGTVTPPDFPLTAGSAETHFSYYPLTTPYDLRPIAGGFVTKMNTTGTALLYSTLVDQTPAGLTINAAGSAYIVGASLPYLPPLTQFTLETGDPTGSGTVVTRLTPDGTQADLTVFLGCLTPLVASGNLITLDSSNNILVAGATACATFPAGTDHAFQPQHAAGTSSQFISNYDGLIVKVAADARSVLAATFLGGSDTDQITAIRVASDDSVMVAGGTSSTNFPVTPDALNQKYSGGAIPNAGLTGDGFFAHLSPNLDQLLYSTWLGGASADVIGAMALDLADNAYLGGYTLSGSSLDTPGVFSFGSSGILWALKIARDTSMPPVIESLTPATLTAGAGDSTIQIAGSNFAQNAVVLVNAVNAATTFQSSIQLTAILKAPYLANAGVLQLQVLNPASGASNSFLLPVVAAVGTNSVPGIGSLFPDGLPAGSPGQMEPVSLPQRSLRLTAAGAQHR